MSELADDGIGFLGGEATGEQVAHFVQKGDLARPLLKFVHPTGEFQVGLLQRRLGLPALGDVAADALHRSGCRSLRHPPGAHLKRDPTAALGDDLELIDEGRFRGDLAGDHLAR